MSGIFLLLATAKGAPPAVSGYALFGGGTTSATTGGLLLTTVKYTYSNNAISSGTKLGTARSNLAGAGNATVGVFGGGTTGSNTAVTDIYTYSGDGVVSGTNLGTARYWLGGAGKTHQ